MTIKVKNDLHGTEVAVIPLETYALKSDQMCAVIPFTEYERAREALCGMSDCRCGKVPDIGFDDNGTRYVLKFSDGPTVR